MHDNVFVLGLSPWCGDCLVHIFITGRIIVRVLTLITGRGLRIGLLSHRSAWVESTELSSGLIHLEGFILEHLAETGITKNTNIGVNLSSVLLLLQNLVHHLLVDLDLLSTSDSACTFLLDLILDTLRPLLFPDIWVGNQPSLLVQLGCHKVSVHV